MGWLRGAAGWSLDRRTYSVVEMTYHAHYKVVIPCDRFAPRVREVSINRLRSVRRSKDPTFRPLGDFFLDVARRRVASLSPSRTTIKTVSDAMREIR